jgi:hypothetical protein
MRADNSDLWGHITRSLRLARTNPVAGDKSRLLDATPCLLAISRDLIVLHPKRIDPASDHGSCLHCVIAVLTPSGFPAV